MPSRQDAHRIVRTVTGDIAASSLGVTYSHEHVFFELPDQLKGEAPDMHLQNEPASARELQHFQLAGGQSLLDMTTEELGRDVLSLSQLSRKVNVSIIAATGYHKAPFSQSIVDALTVEDIANKMIRDVTVGVGTTDIRCGVIKAASSQDEILRSERKVIEAAAIAHRRTGAPISTHTDAGRLALEQLDQFEMHGVVPERVLLSHLDRKLDIPYHTEVLERGAFIGFDQIGKNQYHSDDSRARCLCALLDRGFGDQIVLSSDMARTSYLPSYGFGNGPGLTHILWNFIPRLVQMGVDIETAKRLLIDNPRAVLSFDPQASSIRKARLQPMD